MTSKLKILESMIRKEVLKQINESVFSVDKNAAKLKPFGILPIKIIHAESSDDYSDSGSNVTDRSVPDFSKLQDKYKLEFNNSKVNSKIRFWHLRTGTILGEIYAFPDSAGRIISYQSPQMETQGWHINLIFASAQDAKTAWNNLLSFYKLDKSKQKMSESQKLPPGNEYSPVPGVSDETWLDFIRWWNDNVKYAKRSDDPYRTMADAMDNFIVHYVDIRVRDPLRLKMESMLFSISMKDKYGN